MLQSRPACRRPTVGPAFQTIPELVRGAGDRFGDVEAVADGPLRLTFAELADRVRVAAGAFASAGVGRGDRVRSGRRRPP